jgi:hypothetical protein
LFSDGNAFKECGAIPQLDQKCGEDLFGTIRHECQTGKIRN